MAGQVGIAPADLDRSDLFSVLAMVGAHRHPDYWLPDYELAPDDEDEPATGQEPTRGSHVPRGRPAGRVASQGALTPGQQARRDSREVFAARRAAARGEGPAPVAAAPTAGAASVASLLSGGRVSGGD